MSETSTTATERRASFQARVASWRAQEASGLARVRAGLRIGCEWTSQSDSGFVRYVCVVPSASTPGQFALRSFDKRGFSGHTEHRWDELAKEIVSRLGPKVQPAPGALDRMAPGFDPPWDFIVVVKGPRLPRKLWRVAGKHRAWPQPRCARTSSRRPHWAAARRSVLAWLSIGTRGGWHWWRERIFGIRQDGDWMMSRRHLH